MLCHANSMGGWPLCPVPRGSPHPGVALSVEATASTMAAPPSAAAGCAGPAALPRRSSTASSHYPLCWRSVAGWGGGKTDVEGEGGFSSTCALFWSVQV